MSSHTPRAGLSTRARVLALLCVRVLVLGIGVPINTEVLVIQRIRATNQRRVASLSAHLMAPAFNMAIRSAERAPALRST